MLMKKIFASAALACAALLAFSAAGCQAAAAKKDVITESTGEDTAGAFIFDGFKLSPLTLHSGQLSFAPPVTEGNYFAVFFVQNGYEPSVKLLKAGKDNIKMDRPDNAKQLDAGAGFIAGVVYRSVRGGKLSYRKGISDLIKGSWISFTDSSGKTFGTESGPDGTYGISLHRGKYRMTIDGQREAGDLLLKEGATVIKNIGKGAALID